MFPVANQSFGYGGFIKVEKVSTILPSATFTKPTAQGLAEDPLAVSKSMAVKFSGMVQSNPKPKTPKAESSKASKLA
jgi:hypothetical protein